MFEIWKPKKAPKEVFLFEAVIKNRQVIGNRYDLDDDRDLYDAKEYVRLGFEEKFRQINCDFKGEIRFDPDDFHPETTFLPYHNPKKLLAESTRKIQVVVKLSKDPTQWLKSEERIRSAVEGKGMELLSCEFKGTLRIIHAFTDLPEYDFEDTWRER